MSNEFWTLDDPHVVVGDFDDSTWWRVFATRHRDGRVTVGTGSNKDEAIASCEANIARLEREEQQVSYNTPFVEYVRAQQEWSLRTFGPGTREKGVIDHIRKELKEIVDAAPDGKLAEWIDIIILGIDGAWRTGATADQVAEALGAKQVRNFNRTWPDWRGMSEDQAIEHDRTVDSMPPLPYVCLYCRVQQHASGLCVNCGRNQVVPDSAYLQGDRES